MPSRTSIFQQFPWVGGVNTSLDESTIPANQLVRAENCVFGTRGSRKKREGINFDWDDQSNGSDSVIGLADFWFGAASRTQARVAVTTAKTIYSYNSSGVRSADLFAGTAWGSAITKVCFEVITNLLVLAVDGTSNVMKKWTGSGNFADLGGTPPVASVCRAYLGRLWTNDKTKLDRLHYSTTGNAEEWNGVGDSGGLDIGSGDGDPSGITAILPPFKGVLFVAKENRLYKIANYTPEDFQPILVSAGIGCIAHNSAAAIDQDDVVFASQKGFHSLSATDAFGDFASKYISKDIQSTFNEKFTKSRRQYIQGVYLPTINSVAFAVTDSDYSATENKAIWLYNIDLAAWYVWPNISCQSLAIFADSDKPRFYIGTSTTRVAKTFAGTNYDSDTSGTSTAIMFTVKTGVIFVDESPFSTKGFKRFVLYYRPIGTHTVTVTIKIDNYPAQSLSFSTTNSGALLGSTFVLGTSVLGSSLVMGPFAYSIDGFGRGIQVTIEQSGTDQEVEIQGFGLEFEPSGTAQEVIGA